MELDGHELISTATHCAVLTVSSERHGHSVHLRLRGELDMATSPLLEAWLVEAERDTTDIVVDLENVTFMDSAGIHAFQQAADRAAAAGRGFTLRKPPHLVRRLLQLTHATHHLLAQVHPAFSSPRSSEPAPGRVSGPTAGHPVLR